LLTPTETVQSIKEMDQKELEEALPKLREEAVKAEEALRFAQDKVRAASGRQGN
jgi:diadenosine tetraphosphate (Ap4A) HIT family hydrolase